MIRAWLKNLKLEQFADAFEENQIEPDDLTELTEDDLRELGLPMGPRKRLLKAVAAQSARIGNPTSGTAKITANPPLAPVGYNEAERRQLTVMFCDLADSTKMSEQFDPEDLGVIMRAYQNCCAEIISRYEGYIARYMGDGILVYFGFPLAHEDDAERALHSGLEICDSVAELAPRPDLSLKVRVGVATGPVVVGATVGDGEARQHVALGTTPNLAARLQGLAHPNTVVVSAVTHKLVADRFNFLNLGPHTLKGFADPIDVWTVSQVADAENSSTGRLTAQNDLSPLIGRTAEIERLNSLRAKAAKGDGQVVMVSGEAGVGKSRVVLAMQEFATEQQVIEIRCSAHHMNSALHPIIEFIERDVFRFTPDDTTELKLEKLNGWLTRFSSDVEDASVLMTDLLSIAQPKEQPALNLTPLRQKERTLDMLIQVFLKQADTQSVLFAIEDLHWADPSTLELLDRLIEPISKSKVLCLLTHRPAFTYNWRESTSVSHLELQELSHTDSELIITNAAKGRRLPAEVVRYIREKTDGIPLFLEELTLMMIENEWLIERENSYELTAPLSRLPVPITLQDSLASRLDRLDTAKYVAQLAATIGREFTFDMLHAIPGHHRDKLSIHLEYLVDAGLLLHKGSSSDKHYMFKHALIQDSAYNTLLKTRRKQFHKAIAVSFETQQELIDTQPELLAHHYTEAEETPQAIGYWQKAGERAVQRSAMPEAIAHLSTAVEQCAKLPEGAERLGSELMAQTYLGLANMQQWGYGHPDVEKAFSSARDLCKVMGDPPQTFPVLHGLVKFRLVCGEYVVGLKLARQLQATAEETGDVNLLIEALYVVGAAQCWMGNSKESMPNLDKLVDLYDPVAHAGHALIYGEDPYVTACSHNLWQRTIAGDLAGSKRDLLNAERRVLEIDHPWSTDYMLTCKTHMLAVLNDYKNTEECAITFRDSAIEHGFPWWVAAASINLGWAIAHRGKVTEGLEMAVSNVAAWRSMGAELAAPNFYLRVAEIHLLDSNPSEALIALDEGISIIAKTCEGLYEAEMHRVKGEALALLDRREEALTEFSTAMAMATQRNQHIWYVRAALNHSRLSEQIGTAFTDIEPLKKAIAFFTEAEDLQELIEARALIENAVVT